MIGRIAIGAGKVGAGLVLGTATIIGADLLLQIPNALAAGCMAIDISKFALAAKGGGLLILAAMFGLPAVACLMGGARDLGLNRAVRAAITGANHYR